MYPRNAIGKYQQTNAQSDIMDADPHRLIQMLLAGALDRLAIARGHMQRGELRKKGEVLGRAMQIVGALQSSLNLDQGGDIAFNLYRLYDYMMRRLADANRDNSEEALIEVTDLLKEIKSGWDGIREEALKLAEPASPAASVSAASL